MLGVSGRAQETCNQVPVSEMKMCHPRGGRRERIREGHEEGKNRREMHVTDCYSLDVPVPPSPTSFVEILMPNVMVYF